MEELLVELLYEIMKNLDSRDLMNLRLVNREWNHVACKYLKLNSKSISLRTDHSLKLFMDTMEITTPDFPFPKIHLELSNIMSSNIETFAEAFGAQITEYDLDLDCTGSTCTAPYYEAVRNVGILLKSSPKLEILRIKDENIEMDFSKFKFEENFPKTLPRLRVLEIQIDQLLRQSLGTKVHFGLLHKLVRITPALQLFIIHFIGNGFWNGQLSNLLIATQHVPRINLVNLSMRTEDVRIGNIQSLVAIKCQIQELSLVLLDAVYNLPLLLRLLFEWLEVGGQNLRKLKLTTNTVGFCLPFMKNLVSLELNITKKLEADREQKYQQRFLSEQFSRLEVVHLTNYSERYGYFTSSVFAKVTTLVLDSYYEDNILEQWDQSFPNLKSLELLKATPKHLLSVFNFLNYILTLKIGFDMERTTEEEVTEVLMRNSLQTEILSNSESLISNGVDSGTDFKRKLPSFSLMKNLQYLEIKSYGRETIDTLVRISASSQLRVLRSLKIILNSKSKNSFDFDGLQKLTEIHDHVVTQNASD